METKDFLKEITVRYYNDPVFHAVVEEAIRHTLSQIILPGHADQIREAARQAAGFSIICLEQHKIEEAEKNLPQPGEPTMNLLIDERTGKPSKTLSHLPIPGNE